MTEENTIYELIIDSQKQTKIISVVSQDIFIPLNFQNKDYQKVLVDTIEMGADCWSEEIPTSVQEDADAKLFNQQSNDYRDAKNRLDQYIVLDGSPEVTQTVEVLGVTEFNPETGQMDPVTHEVVVQPAIEPVDEFIEVTNFDDETQQEVTETVRNPVVVKDEEERTAAQAVVDATPQAVKEHVDNE